MAAVAVAGCASNTFIVQPADNGQPPPCVASCNGDDKCIVDNCPAIEVEQSCADVTLSLGATCVEVKRAQTGSIVAVVLLVPVLLLGVFAVIVLSDNKT